MFIPLAARQAPPSEPPAPTPQLPDDSVAPQLLAINSAIAALALLSVISRVYVRSVMLKTFGADDALIIAAMLCGLGVLACWVGETKFGIGRHMVYLRSEELSEIQHYQYFHSMVIVLGISLVKLSVGSMLLRIVQTKLYRRILWGLIVFLILFTLACEGTLALSCIPPAAAWDKLMQPNAFCFSLRTFTDIGLFNTSVNIATDIAFAVLPIPIVLGLQLCKKAKLFLIIVFALGFFACAAAIVKLTYQINILYSPDNTRLNLFNLWQSVELYSGILAASLPPLRPLLRAIRGISRAALSTTRRSSSPRQPTTTFKPARHLSGRREGLASTRSLVTPPPRPVARPYGFGSDNGEGLTALPLAQFDFEFRTHPGRLSAGGVTGGSVSPISDRGSGVWAVDGRGRGTGTVKMTDVRVLR